MKAHMASPTARNQVISSVVTEWLATHPVSGTALVVDDSTGRIAAELTDFGVEVTRWNRLETEGPTWLPQGRWDTVITRLPKGKDALDMYTHGAAARLKAGGLHLLCGSNDEGVKSAGKRLSGAFDEVTTSETRRKCRLFSARSPKPDVRADLDSWALACEEDGLTWVSFPGVFAHGRLDPGTQALVRCMELPEPGSRILDFGCGAGLLSMSLRMRRPGLSVDLLDVDGVAVEAARRNLPDCRVIHSDGWAGVRGERWDLIVSNPPFHDGVVRDHGVLDRLVRQATDHLVPGGVLVLVCQRNVPVMDRLVEAFGKRRCERLHQGKYQVWRAVCSPASRKGRAPRR
jgi:16S rRNA (guanine1207-N2)-methyltransferase